jgi:thiamine pyrophosphate-dependent acetolactate synthase large subunit-like protein
VLVLAGDTPTGDPQHIQSFEQAPFVQAAGATPVPLRAPATWAADLGEALARAVEGPVVLNLPTDYQLAPAPSRPPMVAVAGPVRTIPIAAATGRAAAALVGAERPVVVAGRGAIDAAAEVGEVAERLGAPIVTTLGARGMLPDSAAHLGFIGGIGHQPAVHAVELADCLLAVGASLNVWTTKGGSLLAGKRLVRLDREARAFSLGPPADVALLGDAAPTLAALAMELPGGRVSLAPASANGRSEAPEPLRDGAGCVDPRRALAALESALPADRTLVLDGGHFLTFACVALSVRAPERFLFTPDFATIGQGLAVAIGAGVAAPDERTTLVAGDGGFLMSVAELDTAVRDRVPLNLVVLNDSGYGQEVHSLAAKGKRSEHAVFDVPDLGALGRGFGAEGARLASADDLQRLPELLTAPGGPRVIDIRINRDVVSPQAREIFRQMRTSVELEGAAA